MPRNPTRFNFRIVTLVVSLSIATPTLAGAQAVATNIDGLRVKVKSGDTVYVTDETGREKTAQILDLSASSLILSIDGTRREVTIFCRGHHWVHFRCGPVTRSPSRRWLGRSASSVSFPPRMRPKLRRFLTFPPVRLTFTEHVCLVWTH